MTDKEKLEKIKKLSDAMYYAAQYLTTDALRLHKAMDEYHKFIIYEYKEEPVSEDERIRNFISNELACLRAADEKGTVRYNELTEAISWFEKQGEQKPADNVIEDEKSLLEKFKQAVYDCAWGKVTCKKEGETKEEYANRWAEHFLLIVRDWADDYIDFTIQQKLRKSYDKGKENAIKENISSWSEEDENIIRLSIENLTELEDRYGKEYGQVGDCIDWLESIKDRVQPKKEWSGGDNRKIEFLLNLVNEWCDKAPSATPMIREEMSDWIKSLHPQKQWRPSAEQIKCFKYIVNNHSLSPHNNDLMTDLYIQLKALLNDRNRINC